MTICEEYKIRKNKGRNGEKKDKIKMHGPLSDHVDYINSSGLCPTREQIICWTGIEGSWKYMVRLRRCSLNLYVEDLDFSSWPECNKTYFLNKFDIKYNDSRNS